MTYGQRVDGITFIIPFSTSDLEDKLDSYPGSVCGSPGAGWQQGWQEAGVEEELPGPR